MSDTSPRGTAGERLRDEISAFEEGHQDLIEVMRLFGISNAEYERAMSALAPATVSTAASTQTAVRDGVDALLE